MTIINIKKGDSPIPTRTIWRSREAVMAARGYPKEDRDDVVMRATFNPADPKVQQGMAALGTFNTELIETLKINEFNHQLVAYRQAAARLLRYVLSEGQSLLTEQRGTGIMDEDTGEEIMEEIVIQPEIEPLPAEIEQIVFDEDGNESTAIVQNPAITSDVAEREIAQSTVDATPQEVKDFDAT